jgi:hypothetical protein
MLALLRRLLPLALAIPGLYAQNAVLDCNQPADVQITPSSPIANVTFPGLPGDTVYIRLLATTTDPRFALSFQWLPIRSATSSIRGHAIKPPHSQFPAPP